MQGRIARALALVAMVALGLASCGRGTSVSTASTAPDTFAKDGGLRVTLQAQCPSGGSSCAFSSVFAQTMSALEQRARAGLGAPAASVKRLDGTRLEVDLPGYTDKQMAVSALTTQGDVRFIDTGGNPLPVGTTIEAQQYPTLFTGSQIDPASVAVQTDNSSGQLIVTFAFKGAAASQFAQYTGSHIGQYLTITLDNRVIESATIQAQIAGLGQIEGNMTMIQAQTLAACLKSAPLPGPVTLVSETVVTPTGA